ncbi:MAG: hypothetical protein A2Y94_03225 [Caldithrix sp. RBG_13_44_9]|nr:MAG: hypothetical protein A2Y94_03225 [Caldithrix sp. RBG_13_44_9]
MTIKKRNISKGIKKSNEYFNFENFDVNSGCYRSFLNTQSWLDLFYSIINSCFRYELDKK